MIATRPHPKLKPSALVPIIKSADQDHEFYPTTKEILDATLRDMKGADDRFYEHKGHRWQKRHTFDTLLDIGAGNGKALEALKEAGFHSLYAIEKSEILRAQLDAKIFIIGTEFEAQSLISKKVDVIFCNPPYSSYEAWMEKIIRQSAAHTAYLVVPARWRNVGRIADAIEYRTARVETVGSFDFEDAEDRRARANVELLRIEFREDKDDAFERFFRETFADLVVKFEGRHARTNQTDYERRQREEAESKQRFSALVVGPSYPAALVNLYTDELATIQRNYHLVGQLDDALLRELDISPSKIMACLKQRLETLRHDYWHELFGNLETITSRLTSQSRKNLLETLHRHVHVDFTLDNIFAIILWIIKNANRYIESQLIDTYEKMVAKCNVHLYKSNQRTWRDELWRYCHNDEPDKPSHYSLDYRIVTHRVGGISTSSYSFEKGLEPSGAEFLGDLLTIANNLGFHCETSQHCLTHGRDRWISGTAHEFDFRPPLPSEAPANAPLAEKLRIKREREAVKSETLYHVRAFQNRNLHLRMNQKFILALNVEFGRLKGWLRSGEEAVTELNEPQAAQFFKSNLQLSSGDAFGLLAA